MALSHRAIALLVLAVWLQAAPGQIQAQQSHKDQASALDLWERAIAAKGGRENLSKVKSLNMSYQETTRNFLGIVVHRGLVERIYAFPDRVWSWDDGLPSPFHLSVGWLNIKENKRCVIYAGSSTPVCSSAKQRNSPPDEGITQAQYLYLMETNWVKPTPVRVSSSSVRSTKVDVLTTQFENKRIDYFLDRKSHLPLRVAVFYNGSERPTLTVDLSDYHVINGIQMPGKQKRTTINFEINPPYDAELFTRPPSIEAGPNAWKHH